MPVHDSLLLDVQDLSLDFMNREGGHSNVLQGVSLQIRRGETLALVGESGSGKSVTALAINRLLATPPARITAGKILLQGQDLLQLSERQMRHIRGNDMAMIFQEPMSSLHPTYTVGHQIIEQIRCHEPLTQRQARERAIDLLDQVRIPDPGRRIDEYPHKLSGGMCQRVMIAMALACNPRLLIADEISTALDVTVQAQILQLLQQLQQQYGIGILFITHDLNVVAEVADRVAVMYSGRVVEQSSVQDLFDRPEHPYTIGLLAASPALDRSDDELPSIAGRIPDPAHRPAGCQFHPRCPFAIDKCRLEAPPLRALGPDKWSACWRAPLEDMT